MSMHIDPVILQAVQITAERVVALMLAQYAPVAVEYLNTKQAAIYVGLSEEYLEIARHRDDGSGPNFIKLPRAVRYRRGDLDAWMEIHRKEYQPLPAVSSRKRKSA